MKICYIDIKTSDMTAINSRIFQIAIMKAEGDSIIDEYFATVNPLTWIQPHVLQKVDVTPDEIAEAPTWQQVGPEVAHFIEGYHIAGFNAVEFILPVLAEEFCRIGKHDVPRAGVKVIDTKAIYHRNNPRDFTHCVKQYLGSTHHAGEDAQEDAWMGLRVLDEQIEQHDLQRDPIMLDLYCTRGRQRYGWSNMLYYNAKQQVCFSFGRYAGQPVTEHSDYAKKLMRSDNLPTCFKLDLKKVVAEYVGDIGM